MRMEAPPASQSAVGLTKAPAAAVYRKCTECEEEEESVQMKPSGGQVATAGHAREAPPMVHEASRSSGQTLDATTRAFMEPRFGHDFSQVRVHADAQAAASAKRISALAFTSGSDIVFGDGQFAPETASGQRLLAHELAHVVQQTGAAGSGKLQRAPEGVVQRAPTISILDENFVGPPSATQRRAERSCPINCCDKNLGTLHAMPLFHSASRTAIVPAGSPLATGIGASLHFIASGISLPASNACHCDDLLMIQIVTSNDPQDPRGNNSFVDNNNVGTSPFYGATGLQGRGEHTIDPRFVDAGEKIKTSESIYDIPFRTNAMLAASGLTSDFSWMAETCVSCIKNTNRDRILGCVTYGFTRAFNAATNTFGPMVDVAPACHASSSANFTITLATDPTTTAYDFEEAPDAIDCGEVGDFPVPRGDTRLA